MSTPINDAHDAPRGRDDAVHTGRDGADEVTTTKAGNSARHGAGLFDIRNIIGLLLLVWELVAKSSGGTFPGPGETWTQAVEVFRDPFYSNGPNDQGIGWNILFSLERVGVGFGLAALVLFGLLAALSVLIFTFIWNDFFWATVMLQDDANLPITVGVRTLNGEFVQQWQLISAASLLAALPPVIMFFAMQKHFIAGLTLGATKG